MRQEIYVIDDDNTSVKVFEKLFEDEKQLKFIGIHTDEIDEALKNIPSLIIINEDSIKRDIISLCKKVRQDEDNQITPLIVVAADKDKRHKLDLLSENVEYYIQKPVDENEICYIIKNILRLIQSNRKISALTGLPGNVQIHAELKKRISRAEEFSVLYLDLDNFKAYNDVYGFLKGDDILSFTASVINDVVHKAHTTGEFVGHIGGDDFIAIVPDKNCESICQDIMQIFDTKVVEFFTKEDVERGYVEIENRKGVMEQFGLTSISIGVVVADRNRFTNMLEIGEIGAQVKHAAKSVPGSTYVINKRKLR